MGWADTKFETINLGNARHNKGAVWLVERLISGNFVLVWSGASTHFFDVLLENS